MSHLHKYLRLIGGALAAATLCTHSAHAQSAESTPEETQVAAPAPREAVPSPEPTVKPEPPAAVHPAGATASHEHADADAASGEVDISAYTSDAAPTEYVDQGPSLRFYGFADVAFQTMSGTTNENRVKLLLGESGAFMLGNLNLYAAGNLSERWRSLAEIRFTVLPDGKVDTTSGTLSRISTAANDYANLGANVHWGGIVLERAWLEYSAHGLLNIRGGLLLTPYGIWNVDHGTPTIIPAIRPVVINSALFPTRQTGLEIYGSGLVGDVTLGYHLTLSNGRGSLENYGDLDHNKAVGGRLYATFNQLGTLTFGASGYLGRATYSNRIAISGTSVKHAINDQYDELSLAGDLLWRWEGIHVQAEFLTQQVRYTKEGVFALPSTGGLSGVLPDYTRIGSYLVLGYRLPWLPVMPFVQLEYNDNGGWEAFAALSAPSKIYTYAGGLNYRPIPSVTLKAQYYRLVYVFADDSENPVDVFQAVAAWSF